MVKQYFDMIANRMIVVPSENCFLSIRRLRNENLLRQDDSNLALFRLKSATVCDVTFIRVVVVFIVAVVEAVDVRTASFLRLLQSNEFVFARQARTTITRKPCFLFLSCFVMSDTSARRVQSR